GLAAFYPHPGRTIPQEQLLAAVALLLTISALAAHWSRRYPFLLVGWLWYLGMLVPVIGLVQVGSQQMADRYTYLPLVGVFIVLGWSATIPVVSRNGARLLAPLALGMLAIFAVLCSRQADTWRGTEQLFSHAIAVTRPNALAELTLGNEYRRQGRRDKALIHLERALSIDPRAKSALNSLGQLALDQGLKEQS